MRGLLSMDLSAYRSYPGVIAVVTVADVPGHTDIARCFRETGCWAGEIVEHIGQPILRRGQPVTMAKRAQGLRVWQVEYQPLPPVLNPAEAWKRPFM